MDFPALGRVIVLHKYQSRAFVVDPGIGSQELKVKAAESGGKILSNKQLRSTTLRNPVPRFVHIFDANYLHCSYSTSFKSKFSISCLKQSHGGRWRLNETDTDAVKDELSLWFLRTQGFWNVIKDQLGKTTLNKRSKTSKDDEDHEMELDFLVEQTVDKRTLKADLSAAAIISIEQLSRLNGLTGRKMQVEFEAHAPIAMRNEARNLVEYCCFCFLARDSSDVHQSLKDAAFRQLMFITMLAWQHPYLEDAKKDGRASENINLLKRMLVGKEAFVRIAPAIAGVADRPTAHHLFRALVGDKSGLSLDVWNAYISELLRVHQGRSLYHFGDGSKLELAFDEKILCIGASSKRPVLKWDRNIAWPGRLTLTDRALYFEANDLTKHQKAIRLDLTNCDAWVGKTKVGPFGVSLFDSAISVSSSSKAEVWTLEFVDFHGEMRRDVWHAFIKEIISVYAFIREYGPADNEPSVTYVNEVNSGSSKAVTSAVHGIARLQSLHSMQGITIEDPIKNAQFSYLHNAPGGDLVYEALAVEFWGGFLENKSKNIVEEFERNGSSTKNDLRVGPHAVGSDGSIYLRTWMRSTSWGTGDSIAFWKQNSGRQALVIARNLVVGDANLVERAVLNCKQKSQMFEKTQATINAALLKGIPSNIDLFKELVLPFAVIAINFRKLICWEKPLLTISFLGVSYTLIYKNWLRYIFPFVLIVVAVTILVLKALKAQGRLGRNFGRVTIQENPPANTIQKIIALKEAMNEMEDHLQKLNVALLKLRTIFISGQTQVTNEVALSLLGMATVLIIFPFRYVSAFILLDVFTRKLKFRQKMILQFETFLKEWWATIPAAPVVVLPFRASSEMIMQSQSHTHTLEEDGHVDNKTLPAQSNDDEGESSCIDSKAV